jgi:D-3-phosphoglycerate dehydrogenase
MKNPVDALVVDLLEWIGPSGRRYDETVDVWRTSCPRLPVWEEAQLRGFVEHHHKPGEAAHVALTRRGTEHLRRAQALRRSAGLVRREVADEPGA